MESLNGRGARGSVEMLPHEPGTTVVKLAGEIDISNVDELGEVVDHFVSRPGDRVVFDLVDLQFLDSSGIAMLLRTAARVGAVELRRPTRIVRRVVEAAGLAEVLRVEQ